MRVAVVSCFETFSDRQTALADHFRDRGDQVTPFLSDFQHVSKSYRFEAPEGFQLVHAKAYRKNLSLRRMASHRRFAADLRHALEAERWDLIWAIVPPNSLVKQCALYKRAHPGTALVFDVNDLWPESFPLGGVKKLPPFRLWQSLRDKNLPAADHVVTECDLFRTRLGLAGEGQATTIYYCKRGAEPAIRPAPRLAEDHFSVCYLGSINHIIDIDAIAAILTSLSQQRPVRLHIIGAGERKVQLIERAQVAGADVVDHGAVYDPAEKQVVFDQCHFGLNVMKPTVCVGLTMKSIDYLAGGLPLINTIPGDTWDLIERHGFGLNWGPSSRSDWVAFDQERARIAARQFFERELSYPQFCRRVDSVLGHLSL